MGRTERPQTLARGFQLGELTSLLFNQVILDTAASLGGLEDSLPVGYAFPEQDLVPFGRIRRPVFTMDGANAPRVGSDPRHRVGTPLQTSSHIQLQHDRGFRVPGKNIHRAL